MSRLVMKFGGTSMTYLERIRTAAELVASEVRAGKQVAVVVSAMAGITNQMVAWADQIGPAAQGLPSSDDEYDVVVTSGEQITTESTRSRMRIPFVLSHRSATHTPTSGEAQTSTVTMSARARSDRQRVRFATGTPRR